MVVLGGRGGCLTGWEKIPTKTKNNFNGSNELIMRRFARKFHSNFQFATNHESGLEFDYCCSDAQNRCLAVFMLCNLTSEFLLSAFSNRDPLADHNFRMIQLIFATSRFV